MKIKDIIQNINKEAFDVPAWEELAQLFEIYNLYWSEDKRLCNYVVKSWNCTDTWVGWYAYFLDDEFICFSTQNARKSSPSFKFISVDAKVKLKNYLQSLVEDNDRNIEYINIDDEIESTYKLDYSNQLISRFHKEAVYGNEKVIVIKVDRSGKDVMIKFENSITKIVNITDLSFHYNTRYTQHNFDHLTKADYRDFKIKKLLE